MLKWINVKSNQGKKPIIITVSEKRETIGDVFDLASYAEGCLPFGKITASVRDFSVSARHGHPDFEPLISSRDYSWYGNCSLAVDDSIIDQVRAIILAGELDLANNESMCALADILSPGWVPHHTITFHDVNG